MRGLRRQGATRRRARGRAGAEAGNLVLDLYAIDVTVQAGSIVPIKLREAIRARGPTIFPAFTKPGSARPPCRRTTMYRYDEFDAEFVAERVAQFRDQTADGWRAT